MNHYINIMQDLDDKSDIQTDEEMLLFSETESEEEIKEKKRKLKPRSNIKWILLKMLP